MPPIPSLLAVVAFASGATVAPVATGIAVADPAETFSKSALLTPEQATSERIAALAAQGFETIVLPIAPDAVTRLAEKSGDEWVPTGLDSHARSSELFVHADVAMGRRASRICFGFRDGLKAAASRVRDRGLKLGFWFEVARQPVLAEAFPDLLASLRSGAPWTRRFEGAPADDATHVIKCWPWLPATSLESLVLHQAWICPLAKQLPLADFVFLNDLQGGPSACGCGNLQCRWISDYGEKQTSTPTGPDAAARLVASVREAFLRPEVVPVWTSECEREDTGEGGNGGLCGGIPCYDSACWRVMWEQLDPVAAKSPVIGLLLATRSFERSGSDDRSGAATGWIGRAIAALGAKDERRAGPPIAAERLLAVLEGAGRAEGVVAAEVAAAKEAGARGVLVAFAPLDQGFEPKLMPFGK